MNEIANWPATWLVFGGRQRQREATNPKADWTPFNDRESLQSMCREWTWSALLASQKKSRPEGQDEGKMNFRKIEKRRFTYFLLIVIAREICPCNRIDSNRIEVSPNLRGNGLSSGKWAVRSAWVLRTYTYLLIHIINCIMQCNPFKWAVIKTDLSLRHHPRGFVLSFLFSIKWEEAFNAN